MPLYFIDTFTDGVEDRDTEGLTLDTIGEARALAVETMVDLCREKPKPGEKRVVTVMLRDERNALVYTDTATVDGKPAPRSEDVAIHRAMGAMNRTVALSYAWTTGNSPTCVV